MIFSRRLFLLLSLISTSAQLMDSHAANPQHGFSTELIHRDSPKSPFYVSNLTLSQRFTAAVNRSLIRSRLFNPRERLNTVYSDITSIGSGEYVMKVGFGTPPVEILGIADTGSSLIWTQCESCAQCFSQPDPIFNPAASSTYQNIACTMTQCKVLSSITSCGDSNACMYKQTYLDGSFSNGNLATESLTIGSHTLRSTVFGCGHQNEIIVEGSSGIIGLDFGDASLISQLGGVINGVFSHCLAPFDSNRPSRIKFGSDGVVSGPNVVSTPLTRKPNSNAYFITLEAISVAGTRLAFPGSAYGSGAEANTLIDAGTTLTVLPEDFYGQVAAEVEKAVKEEKTDVNGFSLCYKAAGNINVPSIQMHFKGADLNLGPSNSFPRVLPDAVCLSFIGSPENLAIYGNMGQADFLVGYDRNAATVSFLQLECN